MRSSLLPLLAATATFSSICEAKAVFAHYMMAGITEAHAHQDIDDALAMGLDGFAINIGDPTQSWIPTPLATLFSYAESKGFKLFISLDMSALGSACNAGNSLACGGPNTYHDILAGHLGSSAWYRGPNGFPMISTFDAGSTENTEWNAWRQTFAEEMYFIPDFDDTQGYYDAAPAWYDYWGSTVQGLFSWESTFPLVDGDLTADKAVMAGSTSEGKGYMMGVSSLQYKNAFGGNWYRSGNLNLPKKLANILALHTKPELLEIITWNDGPESHYIGNVWPEANTDSASAKYISSPHTAYQPLLTSFITAFKSGNAIVPVGNAQATGVMWYNSILTTASCSEAKPTGFENAKDQVNWSIVLPSSASGWSVEIFSNCVSLGQTALKGGLNYGAATGMKAGKQKMAVTDGSGTVVFVSEDGTAVDGGCAGGIYNLNPVVVGLKASGLDGVC